MMETDVINEETEEEQTSQIFVILLSATSGSMLHHYLMVDPKTQLLLPKLGTVRWPRLLDLVDFSTCVYRDCMYVIGGKEIYSGRCQKEVLKYDLKIGKWRNCGELNRPRCGHACAVLDDKIFVVGGENSTGAILDTCESYEPLVDEWVKEKPLPSVRTRHACVTLGDSLYLFGGRSSSQECNENVWVMKKVHSDARAMDKFWYEWRPLDDPLQKTLTYQRSHHNAVKCGGKIYIISGLSKAPKMKRSMDAGGRKLKKSNIAVCDCTEIYKPPSKFPVATGNSKILLLNDGNQRYAKNGNQVQKNVPTKRWMSNLPAMRHPRAGGAAVVINKKIFLLGGYCEINGKKESVQMVEYFHTRRQQWCTLFPLGNDHFDQVCCQVLTVPSTNPDFHSTTYSSGKWVMW